MKGNPFFVQPRPGKDKRIFNLIKFRTMTCEKDEYGNLLPDEKRLIAYNTSDGANLGEIERLVSKKIGCKYDVSLSCVTATLHLAVKLAGVKTGDTVFCSDMTFDATVNTIVYEKVIPVFFDTKYDTWNMDPVALDKAFELYPNTKIIVVVNLYGIPTRYDEICATAEKHGTIIIEDAAEFFGTPYKVRETGAFGT